MFSKVAEKTTANLILLGSPLVTVFIVLSTVTDPVNAPKLLAAGGLSFGLLSVFLGFNFRQNLASFRIFVTGLIVFVLFLIFTLTNGDSPLSQNIYGVYGRNSGALTYLLLALVAIGALNIRELVNFRKVVLGLQIAGLINTVYCLWVLTFGDFLSWNNPYGNILGLFGNPNFISSFLGIFIATLFAFAAAPDASVKYRLGAFTVGAAAFYEIVRSHAIQGIVVTLGGLVIVGFFVLRSRVSSSLALYAYVASVSSLGVLAIMGALQKGPFDFVYKTSVSLRGAYWNAGITMGMEHPLTGVGMDSYGDWYRRARSEDAATVLPGPNTITNAAHNVVIDLFAFGGWPLLLSYLFLLALSTIAIVRIVRRRKQYESTFVAITTAWICYQVQSLISINQIGLAIWGWLLTGSLIAYEFATRESSEGLKETKQPNKGKSAKIKQTSGVFSPQLLAGLGIVVGLIVASPPMSADSKWRSALNSNDATQILAALEPNYLNPSNSQRYAQAVQLFANSNLMDQAREVALDAIEFNPNYFDAWKIFHALPNTSAEEKIEALANMKRLDPRNPDVLAQ